MNIIDYAIRVGKALRKIPEGKLIWENFDKVSKKYKDEESFDYSMYNQLVEHEAIQWNFYAWDLAYRKFLAVLKDDEDMQHKELFLKTAKLVECDVDIKALADSSKRMGDLVVDFVDMSLAGKLVEKSKWPYKLINALSDLQMSIQRSGFTLFIIKTMQPHMSIIDKSNWTSYEQARTESKCLPYSDESKEFQNKYPEVLPEFKENVERMILFKHVINQGIFSGFWDIVNEIDEDDIIEFTFGNRPISVGIFSHRDCLPEIIHKECWLYIVNRNGEKSYILANQKTMNILGTDSKTEIKGILYPTNDNRFFEDIDVNN